MVHNWLRDKDIVQLVREKPGGLYVRKKDNRRKSPVEECNYFEIYMRKEEDNVWLKRKNKQECCIS